MIGTKHMQFLQPLEERLTAAVDWPFSWKQKRHMNLKNLAEKCGKCVPFVMTMQKEPALPAAVKVSAGTNAPSVYICDIRG